MSYKKITADYTLAVGDDSGSFNNEEVVIAADTVTNGLAIGVTLPEISTYGAGVFNPRVIVTDEGGGAAAAAITITAGGSDTINGQSTFVLNTNGGAVILEQTGLTSWTAVSAMSGLPIVARTATAAGTTTGTIANGNVFVQVTSADANHIVILPAPIPGTMVMLRNGATGYELRSSAPATVAINGGTGANAESAIGANIFAILYCTTTTAWIGTQFTTAGVQSAVEVAAAP
jgi:hypothetical protein